VLQLHHVAVSNGLSVVPREAAHEAVQELGVLHLFRRHPLFRKIEIELLLRQLGVVGLANDFFYLGNLHLGSVVEAGTEAKYAFTQAERGHEFTTANIVELNAECFQTAVREHGSPL